MHEVDPLHLEPGRADHVELHGDVGVMRLLHLGGGLHLDEVPAPAAPLEHVDGHEDVVGDERGLEDGRGSFGDGALRLLDLLLHVPVLGIHEDAAGEPRLGQLAHPVSLVEDGLEGGVGLELRGGGLVHEPPEELGALDAAAVAGLGEALRRRAGQGGSSRHGMSRSSSSARSTRAELPGSRSLDGSRL